MSAPTILIFDPSLTQAVRLQHAVEQLGVVAELVASAGAALAACARPEVALLTINADTAFHEGARADGVDGLLAGLHGRRPDVSVLLHGRRAACAGGADMVELTADEPAEVAAAAASLARRGWEQRPAELLRRARVLLIDDSITYREYVRIEMEERRVQVHCAGSPAEVFTLLQEGDFDCLLVDLVLPEMDGTRLCTALDRFRRERCLPFHILALTSREDDLRVIEALEAGADDFLGKSMSTEVLMARLVAHLRRVSARKAAPAVALRPAPRKGGKTK